MTVHLVNLTNPMMMKGRLERLFCLVNNVYAYRFQISAG